jgi:hypothetical protein
VATPARRIKRSIRLRVLLTAVVVGIAGAVAGMETWAAFSSTTSNTGDSFAAGSVAISDNDSGAALLSLASGLPGAFDEGCITVTYSGSLAATVKLYGAGTYTSSSSLAPYLDLTITRGSFSSAPAFDSCTGFAADSTDYIGAGAGVIFSGTLAAFNTSYTSFADGLTDPTSSSPEVWSTSEAHVYKIRATLQSNIAAQGLNVTESFTWEAQNN